MLRLDVVEMVAASTAWSEEDDFELPSRNWDGICERRDRESDVNGLLEGEESERARDGAGVGCVQGYGALVVGRKMTEVWRQLTRRFHSADTSIWFQNSLFDGVMMRLGELCFLYCPRKVRLGRSNLIRPNSISPYNSKLQ